MSLSSCKVFFDTQICINAAKNQICPTDWHNITHYIQETAEYCVAATTLGEILLSIANGSDSHFSEGQERLRHLCFPGKRVYLDFPEHFVANTLGFKIRRPPKMETNFGFSVSLILYAQSKADLQSGIPLPFGGTAQVRLDRFLEEVRSHREVYINWFSTLKGGKQTDLSPEEWARNAMKMFKIPVGDDLLQKFTSALSAAYEYDSVLRNLARNRNYDLREHASDLIDAKQLCYLCDPTMVLVTDDLGFKRRLRKNAQSNQILTFNELRDRAAKAENILQPS